jgi:hypothetical protein
LACTSIVAKESGARPSSSKFVGQQWELANSLDQWKTENRCVKDLSGYAGHVPSELLRDYVSALTHTFVGYVGSSMTWARRDFYANGAARYIPKMFELFDDAAAGAFVETVRRSATLKRRIETPVKLSRLRSLANIALSKASEAFEERDFLEILADEGREEELWQILRRDEG